MKVIKEDSCIKYKKNQEIITERAEKVKSIEDIKAKIKISDLDQEILDETSERLQIPKENIEFLAKGGFSRVYKFMKNRVRYALKIVNFQHEIIKTCPEKYKANLQNEVYIIKNLMSKHIVKMFGYLSFKCNSVGIIEEYCENLDLSYLKNCLHTPKLFKYHKINRDNIKGKLIKENFFQKRKKQKSKKKKNSGKSDENISNKNNWKKNNFSWYEKPSESFLRFFINQIFQTMMYLKSMNIAHLDIKLENFFLASNFKLKLGDFFLSQIINKNKNHQLDEIGTLNYMSPEYFMENRYSLNDNQIFKVDYFAIGILILNLMNDKKFMEKSENKNINSYRQLFSKNFEEKKNFQENFLDDKFYDISDGLFELIKGLLNPDIEKRSNLENILKNEWLEKDMDAIKYYYEMNLNDYIKYMLELQKIEYSDFLKKRINEKNLFEEDKNLFEIIELDE